MDLDKYCDRLFLARMILPPTPPTPTTPTPTTTPGDDTLLSWATFLNRHRHAQDRYLVRLLRGVPSTPKRHIILDPLHQRMVYYPNNRTHHDMDLMLILDEDDAATKVTQEFLDRLVHVIWQHPSLVDRLWCVTVCAKTIVEVHILTPRYHVRMGIQRLAEDAEKTVPEPPVGWPSPDEPDDIAVCKYTPEHKDLVSIAPDSL